jgi:DNA polymerase-3 subunit delta
VNIKPIYLVSSDEPLLRQECCDQIIADARANGFNERIVLPVTKDFSWDKFLATANSGSLFSEKILLELDITATKLGNAGSQALQTYCQKIPTDKILLIIADKLEAAMTQSKWYKAINKVGTVMRLWPPTSAQLPTWIAQRLRQAGLSTTNNGCKLLAEFCEGNLLAAAQEITKLELLYGKKNITEEQIADAIVDNSRYNIFAYADAFLAGDTAKNIRILRNLHQEKIEPILIIWILAKELRSLAALHRLILQKNLSVDAAMQQQYVRETRRNLIKSALKKYQPKDILKLLQHCALLDRICKGAEPGDVWQKLEHSFLNYQHC